MYEFSDYLAHHGIQGQKWGQRNGPPYPLSPGAHSAAEQRKKAKNAAKVASWQEREIDKVRKRNYKRQQKLMGKSIRQEEKTFDYNEKAVKAEQSGNSRKAAAYMRKGDKTWKKMRRIDSKRNAYDARAEAEIRAIRDMTLSDIRSERRRVGAKVAAVALSNLVTAPLGLAHLPSVRNMKTNDRLRRADKKAKQAAAGSSSNKMNSDFLDTISNEYGSIQERQGTAAANRWRDQEYAKYLNSPSEYDQERRRKYGPKTK